MKRSFRLLTLICAAMSIFASCSKEPNDPNGQTQPTGPEPDKNYEYLFSLNEAALTKANLSDQAILFEEGDKIGVIVATPEKTSVIETEIFRSEERSNIAFEITQKKGIEKDGCVYAFKSVAGGGQKPPLHRLKRRLLSQFQPNRSRTKPHTTLTPCHLSACRSQQNQHFRPEEKSLQANSQWQQ